MLYKRVSKEIKRQDLVGSHGEFKKFVCGRMLLGARLISFGLHLPFTYNNTQYHKSRGKYLTILHYTYPM